MSDVLHLGDGIEHAMLCNGQHGATRLWRDGDMVTMVAKVAGAADGLALDALEAHVEALRMAARYDHQMREVLSQQSDAEPQAAG